MSKDEQVHSIDRQENQVRPYAARQRYELVKEYKDEGIAGWKSGDARPAFKQMLDDAQKGDFEVVLCDDVDRFGRFDIHKYGAVVDRLREVGVRLETVAQGVIDWEDTLSQINDAIRMIFKKEQSSDTARRILTRFVRMASEGKWPAGAPPYGYRKDPQTQKLVLGDPHKVEVVRWLFTTYAEKDVSLRWLADELFKRGQPSPTGRPHWTGQSLCKMLRNRNYLGDMHWGKEAKGQFQDFSGQTVVKKKGRGTRKRTEPEMIIVPDCFPAIIDRDVFQAVQAKLNDNRERTTPHVAGGDFLLSGLMVCGHCGSWMLGRTGFGGRIRDRLYLCGAYNRWGKKACDCHWIKEAPILDVIVRVLQRDFLNPDNLQKVRNEINRQAKKDNRGDAAKERHLRAQIAAVEKKIATGNRNMALADPDAIQGIAQAVGEFRQERDRLSQELAAMDDKPNVAEAEAVVTEAERQLWKLRQGLEGDDPAEVRAVLRELVSKVELWWDHRQARTKIKSRFARGLIYLRPDEALLHTCNGFQCKGTGTTQSTANDTNSSPAASAHHSPTCSAKPSFQRCFIRKTTSCKRPS
jgi:site-specific DNA recombinase